jgi:hypothetical protein
MIELENLRVSLTKNGYLKIATIVAEHPGHEMLDHVSGSHAGVNLVRSQVANILCADPITGTLPTLWDDLRDYNLPTIRAFTLVAVIFSHERLIRAFLRAGRGTPFGTLLRNEMTEKEFTNLQFAMSSVGLCDYQRGSDQITYDMSVLTEQLSRVGDLVRELLRVKLQRCGWRDPDVFRIAADPPVEEQCIQEGFHEVFGMTEHAFRQWLSGRPRQPR